MIIYHWLWRPAQAVPGNLQGLRRSPRYASMKIFAIAQCGAGPQPDHHRVSSHFIKPDCQAGLAGSLTATRPRHSRQWGAIGGGQGSMAVQSSRAIPPRECQATVSPTPTHKVRVGRFAAPCAGHRVIVMFGHPQHVEMHHKNSPLSLPPCSRRHCRTAELPVWLESTVDMWTRGRSARNDGKVATSGLGLPGIVPRAWE
jgi:hypothetical protein